MRVALRLRAPVVRDVHLAADDRLDARLAGLTMELDRAGQRAVVGERDRRHLEPRRLLDESRDPARPVEDRVLGVDVQVDERRRGGATHGRAIVASVRHSSVILRGCTPRGGTPLRGFALPETVGQAAPLVPQILPAGHPLELPVDADERAEVGLYALGGSPRAPAGTTMPGSIPSSAASASARSRRHRWASRDGPCPSYRHRHGPIEAVPSDGGSARGQTVAPIVRRPTVIEPGPAHRGPPPMCLGPEDAPDEVRGSRRRRDAVRRSHPGGRARAVRLSSFAARPPCADADPRLLRSRHSDDLVATLDAIDAELAAGGLVYVHCWAGCGRTGVVVGCWLVRHGRARRRARQDRRDPWPRLPADAGAAAPRPRLGGRPVAPSGEPPGSPLP